MDFETITLLKLAFAAALLFLSIKKTQKNQARQL